MFTYDVCIYIPFLQRILWFLNMFTVPIKYDEKSIRFLLLLLFVVIVTFFGLFKLKILL